MRKRGKVLRDPHAGPGLLIIEGRQYPFLLEPVWRSEGPPKPGLPVEVDFGPSGQIVAITAVPESQLAKERGEAARRKREWSLLNKLATVFGMTRIIAPASNASKRRTELRENPRTLEE